MPNLEIPLDLPEVRVVKTETDQRQIVITVGLFGNCRKMPQYIVVVES